MNMDYVVDDDNVKIIRLELGSWATNCYIVISPQTGESILIDVPPGATTLAKQLKDTNLRWVLLTHSHIDHYAGLQAFRERNNAPYAVHSADNQSWLPFAPEKLLHHGNVFKIGTIKIETIYTPGHTPGSVGFKIDKTLIGGDTLFPGGPGRTVTPGRFRQIRRSITERIFTLPDDTTIYPGHGQETTVKKAKEEYTVFTAKPHDPKLHGDIVWLTS
jgi:hydroxyacylglutathione hydrolase